MSHNFDIFTFQTLIFQQENFLILDQRKEMRLKEQNISTFNFTLWWAE